jgi:hypothetical protein
VTDALLMLLIPGTIVLALAGWFLIFSQRSK